MAPQKNQTLQAQTFRLPAWTKEALKLAAIKAKIPVQDLVRQMIEKGLAQK